MTDVVLEELQAYLEAALEPLPACPSRKEQIREELLGHLLTIYDEELAYHGVVREALDRAQQRFGSLDGLRAELQRAIPFLERLFFQRVQRKEKTMWRWLFALGGVGVLVGPGFVCPAIAHRDKVTADNKVTADDRMTR